MWPWVALGFAGLVGAAGWFYERWKRQRAEDNVELWRTQSKRLTAELAQFQAAASEELRREKEVSRGLRTELDRQIRETADLVRGNPELAREYLRASVRLVSDPAAGPGPHPQVPGPPPADDAGRGGRGSR